MCDRFHVGTLGVSQPSFRFVSFRFVAAVDPHLKDSILIQQTPPIMSPHCEFDDAWGHKIRLDDFLSFGTTRLN